MNVQKLRSELHQISQQPTDINISTLRGVLSLLCEANSHDIKNCLREDNDFAKGLSITLDHTYRDENYRVLSAEFLGTLIKLIPYTN